MVLNMVLQQELKLDFSMEQEGVPPVLWGKSRQWSCGWCHGLTISNGKLIYFEVMKSSLGAEGPSLSYAAWFSNLDLIICKSDIMCHGVSVPTVIRHLLEIICVAMDICVLTLSSTMSRLWFGVGVCRVNPSLMSGLWWNAIWSSCYSIWYSKYARPPWAPRCGRVARL